MTAAKKVLDKITSYSSVVIFIAMVLMVTYQVIARYFFKSPSSVTEVLTRYCFVWLIIISATYMFGQREHINISVIKDKLPKTPKMIVSIIIELVTICFAGLVMVYGGFTITKMNLVQLDTILHIPTGVIYSIIPICGVIIIFYSIYNIGLELKQISNNYEEDFRMSIALQVALVMVTILVILLIIGAPIGVAIGLSSAVSMICMIPANVSFATSAQRIFAGSNSFSLIAIPFFILAGNIMNNGGIATRLVNCAKVIAGRMPGALAQSNVVANMLFGAISGSGAAAAAAMGSTIGPLEDKEGYDKNYSVAVNTASAPVGMLIPPSNTMIVYSSIAGSVSIAALFIAGYIPGLLWGAAVMVLAGIMAKRRGYQAEERVTLKIALKTFWQAIPSLLLIVIVIGGILAGVFTATEGSAIAVVYATVLSLIYKSFKLKDIPRIVLESAKTTGIITFMIGLSSIMSWAMAFTEIPDMIATAILGLTDNKILILLLINVLLLVVGTFMDVTPAILIFTPILLPICTAFGMSPIQFGILLCFNLSIGTITPPVGTILFTACRVGGTTIESVIKTLLPYFAVILIALLLVTYIPAISMFLPKILGLV